MMKLPAWRAVLMGAALTGLCASVGSKSAPAPSSAAPPVVDVPPSRARRIANATTELDVEQARRLLAEGEVDSPALTFERARLAIYTGDCDAASAILASPLFAAASEGSSMGELAKTCARATAGAVLIDEPSHGIRMRLQDEADRALVPFIVSVAERARAVIERDLGVVMPRPLRIDLVRDLFSLAAVSGLPLSAAETTGTVAVARWGRVTMLSPRATPLGYQWEDTLAHEITHLALSRATRDKAPLWLQEGIAKREETRWRAARPFDDTPAADAIAHAALVSGRAIGVDRLGASIAMLPTPEAASTAFAEVTSFMAYFVEARGEAALRLLLADLKGIGSDDPNEALKSVTGYDLPVWIALWQKHLLESVGPKLAVAVNETPPGHGQDPAPGAELARRVRLGDLLFESGHAAAAAKQLEPAVKLAPSEAAVRWRAARALLLANEEERAKQALGEEKDINAVHGAWFAWHGRFLKNAAQTALAERAFEIG
ncbi:MAG TPA: hypothetical protein VK509_05870, partial [Polyangiales bacterium]|nr:hypothetical protein [Polyangiales bacterium]